MSYKVGMVSLGCPKNQIDAEIMLAEIADHDFEITANEEEADAIIVNTCGFIEDAKREAIDTILELAELKKTGKLKALIVTGCMAQRYFYEISEEMPEVDAVVALGSNKRIIEILNTSIRSKGQGLYPASVEDLRLFGDRILISPPYTAYLRIADGCDNRCTYCAIPQIRGNYRSRNIMDIIDEAKELASKGVRELVLVAQDTTNYGMDLYGNLHLSELIKRLNLIEGIEWIRLLYTYPELIDDDLIDAIAKCDKVVKYLDIPIQHASDRILKLMNRRSTNKNLRSLIEKLRKKIPEITLRTTMIVGFPTETDEDFAELSEFVKWAKFDHLGCFMYSAEEGTKAAEMEDQVEPDIKERRYEVLMMEQSVIAEELANSKVGTTVTVLVEGFDNLNKCYYGRTAADAPDIDTKVFFTNTSENLIKAGSFVEVKITETLEMDLIGETI